MNLLCKILGHKLYYYKEVGKDYKNCSRCGKNIINKLQNKRTTYNKGYTNK